MARIGHMNPRTGNSGRGRRALHVKVKSAKGRKTASTRWLSRHLNDPYVHRARADGYRSRAAYKIMEIDDRFRFLGAGARVIDLGSAPGGWVQVAVDRVNALGTRRREQTGVVCGLDVLPVEPIPGAELLRRDFLEPDCGDAIVRRFGGEFDVVMSDMAPSFSGDRRTDHVRVAALNEAVAEFTFGVLAAHGTMILKVMTGGAESGLQAKLKSGFARVRTVKPPSSRPDSSEKFVVASGFRGKDQG